MSSDLISVIMPCHNSAAYIAGSIESVLGQSHSVFELIIIDDASSDESLSIIQRYAEQDARISLILRKHCSNGPATPRNQGIEIAQGNYLAFIDSDDLWHQEKLQRQLSMMRAKGLSFLSTQHIPFSEAAPERVTLRTNNQYSSLSHLGLIKKNTVVTSSALMSRELLANKRFNQNQEYIGIEDYLLWLHLHQNEEIASGVLEQPLVFYRLRSDSLSSSKLKMASKIFYLLSHYQHDGKPLGIRKYAYFLNYIFASVIARMRRPFSEHKLN